MIFETLFKKTSTGAGQQWTISVDGNVITTEFGRVNGKLQKTVEVIKEGKNQNRANSTTPEEQALAEATATYQGKLKKGYVKSLDGALADEIDAVIGGGMFPMLAHKFSEQGHKIIYPAYIQPKFDGFRCIAIKKDGVWGLWSRTRKPILGVPHIIEALSKTDIDCILDGELYNHSHKDKFEELAHFIKQTTPKAGHEVVQFHIYDIADPRFRFSQRWDMLEKLPLSGPLKYVTTLLVEDEDQVMTNFETFLSEGYEGAMVRNLLGDYVNNRSYDLLKVKIFQDEEFEIVRVEEGKGSMAGRAVFVCVTKEGNEFGAKLIGKMSDLEKYVKNPKLALGKELTVKFQGWTTKNKCPRFPIGVRIKTDL